MLTISIKLSSVYPHVKTRFFLSQGFVDFLCSPVEIYRTLYVSSLWRSCHHVKHQKVNRRATIRLDLHCSSLSPFVGQRLSHPPSDFLLFSHCLGSGRLLNKHQRLLLFSCGRPQGAVGGDFRSGVPLCTPVPGTSQSKDTCHWDWRGGVSLHHSTLYIPPVCWRLYDWFYLFWRRFQSTCNWFLCSMNPECLGRPDRKEPCHDVITQCDDDDLVWPNHVQSLLGCSWWHTSCCFLNDLETVSNLISWRICINGIFSHDMERIGSRIPRGLWSSLFLSPCQ